MPVPKRKVSKQRKNKRHSTSFLKVKKIAKCSNCQEPVLPHQVCSSCGYYKNKKVIVTKKERALKRAREKQSKEVKKTTEAISSKEEIEKTKKET